MRHEAKTRLAGAAGALLTSIVIAFHQAGRLWPGIFGLQVVATVTVLVWSPFLSLSGVLSLVPRLLSVPLSLAWASLAGLPVLYAFVLDLFTGHRRPGSQWYDAAWRVYAIVFIWIGIAVVNERVVKPWWRDNSDRFLSGLRSNSVSAQARQLTLDARAQALEAIKAKVVVVLKKKKLAERTVEEKKRDIGRAARSIEKAEQMANKARERAEKCEEDDEKEAVMEEVQAMEEMVESAKRHEQGLHSDVSRAELDLEEIASQLSILQHEWTEALHIQNYNSFYR